VLDGQSRFDIGKLDFETNLQLFIDKKIVGNGHLSAHDHLANFNLDFSRFPLDYLNFIGDEIRNPYWKELNGLADGNINFKRDFQKDSIALKAQLNFPGSFVISSDLSFDGKWTLNFVNEKWETIFVTPKGEISFFRRAFLDFEKSEVKQFSQEVGVTSIDPKAMTALISSWESIQNSSDKAYFNSVISFKKIQDGENIFNGTFKIGKTPIEKFYQLKLDNSNSQLDLNILEKNGSKSLFFSANKFSLNKSYHFLSPFLELEQGILTGAINGKWEDKWTDGSWKIDLKLSKINDFKGRIRKLLEDSFGLFNHDLSSAEAISINSQWINGDVIFQGLELIKPTSHYVIKGSLSKNKRSELTLFNSLKKKNKPLVKEVTEKFWMSESL
jgi:hypothetical protein